MQGFYHIVNRGVEKRNVFLADKDYVRFIHNFVDFNTIESMGDISYYKRRQKLDIGCPTQKLVHILCWALLPNHSHLLINNIINDGVSKFSRKIFGGYTKHFNEQHDRSGVLFQGKSKIIRIEDDAHLLHLPFYIHLNPLNIFQPKWKSEGIKNIKKAMEFLENYRWSNYRDIVGTGDGEFMNLTDKELFFEVFETNEKRYRRDLEEWLYGDGHLKVGHRMSDH